MDESLPPTILVVFGITGDLSHRYLLPALAEIEREHKLPEKFKILGVSRREIRADGIFGESTHNLADYCQTLKMDPEDEASYEELKSKLELIKSNMAGAQVIFYLVVPPQAVLPIIKNLGNAGLNDSTKLLLEKPFGTDLESAEKLIEEISRFFKEEQVYRIDHYLAKEMAQNIAVFLGSNVLFRDVWHNQFIEKINIVASESIGIENRIEFWEHTGILRDFVQSHLLQLAALVLMEPCAHDFDFADLPKRRLEALKQLHVDDLDGIVRGQYEGYRKEVSNPASLSETFVALTLKSDDPRWAGTPIHIFNGKKLNQKLTQIEVHFKKSQSAEANLLVLRLHPDEGIELDLWVKEPGYDQKLQKQSLRFIYERRFGRLPEAYEQVLVDAMRSKQSLFASSPEVLTSWQILQPVLNRWLEKDTDLIIYSPGSSLQGVLSKSIFSV